MGNIHQHLCPDCDSWHFHVHHPHKGEDWTIRHETCLPCLAKDGVLPDPNITAGNIPWAG